jgi:hypothetical protein
MGAMGSSFSQEELRERAQRWFGDLGEGERLIRDYGIALAEAERGLEAARNRIIDDGETIDRHVAKIGKLQNALLSHRPMDP